MTPKATLVETIGNGNQNTEKGSFNYPRGIHVDSDNNLYVADTGNHRIQKFDGKEWTIWGRVSEKDGSPLIGGRLKEFSSPEGVGTFKGGNFILIADTGNSQIQEFRIDTDEGYFSGKEDENFLPTVGTAPGEFSLPSAIVLDTEKSYIVDSCNHRIQYYYNGQYFTLGKTDPKGEPIAGTEPGEFYLPSKLALGLKGEIYVSDSGNHRIQKFDGKTWRILGNAPNPPMSGTNIGEFSAPKGLTIDKDGNLYVADTGNHRIQKFDGKAWTTLAFQTPEGKPLTDLSPFDLAINPQNQLYVLDSNKGLVFLFNLD